MTTLAMNLKLVGRGVTQFTNYNFTDFVTVNDIVYGFNDSGMHQLDTTAKDNGADIEAYFATLSTNFGVQNEKRVRSIFLRNRGGKIKVTVRFDDKIEFDDLATPVGAGYHTSKARGRNDYKGTEVQIRIDNVDGSAFALRQIDLIPFILRLKPSGSRL